MASDRQISPQHLGLKASKQQNQWLDMTLEQAEQTLIRHAIEQSDGNVQLAADQLGISRAALYRRLEKYGDVINAESEG